MISHYKMGEDLKSKVYSKNVIEFVAVCVEFCSYLENFQDITKDELTGRFCKFLPLIYLKASMLEEIEPLTDLNMEVVVTEEHYNYILARLYNIYAEEDTYLEVFLEDMKYSETPISASISEDLTDIYQDLKNFISVYEHGIEENMNDVLYTCLENFKEYWGQKLVNVLGALHSLKYNNHSSDFEDDNNTIQELW